MGFFNPFEGSSNNGGQVKIEVDKTLSKEGMAADSKTVGDKIKENAEAIQDLKITSKAKLEYIAISYLNWIDNEVTIYSENIEKDSIITLNTGNNITDEQYNALAMAKIIPIEQEKGYIKLKALGVTPQIDIPISILIQGNIIETEMSVIVDSATGEKYMFTINNGTMKLENIGG